MSVLGVIINRSTDIQQSIMSFVAECQYFDL